MRSIVAALLLVAAAPSVFAACPGQAPTASGMFILLECGAGALPACPNGPLTLELRPFFAPFPPFNQPYTILPCDTVTWNFGDGITETVTGSGRVTHDFATPGNYDITATVTNSLGSATLQIQRVIATSPSRLDYVMPGGTYDDPPYAYGQHCGCIVAPETSGSVTVVVERSLDLSRRITAVATVGSPSVPGIGAVAVPLTFLPGEVRKSFTVPVVDDKQFYGYRYFPLELRNVTGGVMTHSNVTSAILVPEDDPRPTMSPATREIRVVEGNGLTKFSLPARLSEAMLVRAIAGVRSRSDTATYDDYGGGLSAFQFPEGETSAEYVEFIRGDTRPEADERFFLRLARHYGSNDPIVDESEVLVTIVNDDAAFFPEAISMIAGTTATLRLDIGSAYATPTEVSFTSTNASAVPAPQPVTIPAGVTRIDIPIAATAAGAAQIRASVPARGLEAAIISVTPPPAPSRRRSARH